MVLSQVTYISALRELDVKGRASHELLTPAEVSAARGLIGGLNYVTTQSRSYEAVSVSQASGNLSENPVVGVLRVQTI